MKLIKKITNLALYIASFLPFVFNTALANDVQVIEHYSGPSIPSVCSLDPNENNQNYNNIISVINNEGNESLVIITKNSTTEIRGEIMYYFIFTKDTLIFKKYRFALGFGNSAWLLSSDNYNFAYLEVKKKKDNSTSQLLLESIKTEWSSSCIYGDDELTFNSTDIFKLPISSEFEQGYDSSLLLLDIQDDDEVYIVFDKSDGNQKIQIKVRVDNQIIKMWKQNIYDKTN